MPCNESFPAHSATKDSQFERHVSIHATVPGFFPANIIYDQLLFFPHCLSCGHVKRRVLINVKELCPCPDEVYNVSDLGFMFKLVRGEWAMSYIFCQVFCTDI